MKPEDLVAGKAYSSTDSPNDILIYTPRPYDKQYNCRTFTNQMGLISWTDSGVTRYLNPIAVEPIGEKTMPVRKPEQIRIELTNEETIQALNLFGYNLEGYEFGRRHNLSIFTLNLKKEANEKTKTTD